MTTRSRARRSKQDDLLADQIAGADADDFVVQVRKAIESVERGGYTELSGDNELRGFFADVIFRGKARVAKRRRTRP